MQSFTASRTVLKVFELLGWLQILLAAIVLFIAILDTRQIGLFGAVSWSLVLTGFLTICLAQIGLAVVVTAEAVQRLEKVANQTYAVGKTNDSKNVSAGSTNHRKSMPVEDGGRTTEENGKIIEEYKGAVIRQHQNGVIVNGWKYANAPLARRAIDRGEV